MTGNEAWAGFAAGGGICNSGIGANMTLSDCVVSRNVANPDLIGQFGGTDSFGGGISNLNGAKLTVINSTVSDNQVISTQLAFGGGIHHNVGTSVMVVNSTIKNNKAVSVAPDLLAVGGGISNSDATLSIVGSRITDNLVTGNQAIGGGVGTSPFGPPEGLVSITDSTLNDNRAVATGGLTQVGFDFSVATAFGGAIAMFGMRLEVANGRLRGNQAIGGSNATQEAPNTADVGAAHGGAIYNTFGAEAVVRDSIIEHNRAIGGNHNLGTGPVVFVGAATGGGIDNSIDGAFVGLPSQPAQLTLINTVLTHNEAIGGDNNTAHSAVPFAGSGLGGSIANYLGATANIGGSALRHNQAVGGQNNTASGGLVPASLGAGGAVFNAFGNFEVDTGDIFAPSIVNISSSILEHNQAEGGWVAAGNAGDGWGGAIADLFDATTNIAGNTLAHNRAIGGEGVCGSDRGNGLGGGAYNDAASSLALVATTVTKNHAKAGEGNDGGNDGEGIGGGLYNLGHFDLDALSAIFKNRATTSFDDLFDPFA